MEQEDSVVPEIDMKKREKLEITFSRDGRGVKDVEFVGEELDFIKAILENDKLRVVALSSVANMFAEQPDKIAALIGFLMSVEEAMEQLEITKQTKGQALS